MGKRGPKKKPTAKKKLEGTHRKDRAPEHEPEPRKDAAILAAPEWLGPGARGEWDRLAPELYRLGLLTVADFALFAAYCDAFSRWKEMTARIEELEQAGELVTEVGENGYRQQAPEASMQRRYFEMLMDLSARFGFDPASRADIDVEPRAGDDPAEALLFGPRIVKGA